MCVVSRRMLHILAATVWYAGGIILLLKGGSLLREAAALRPGGIGPWAAVACGFLIGGLKARLLFNRTCRKNLKRIAALESPRVWQFYRPQFFLFLAAMITLGAILSRLAHGDYPFLIGVGMVDLSIAVSLLGSGAVFWRERVFSGGSADTPLE